MDSSGQAKHETGSTWWVWWDALLEEWFYTDQSLEETPGLAKQLELEKTFIHEVQAFSGVEAVELVCPGFRDQRREDPITRPVVRTSRVH